MAIKTTQEQLEEVQTAISMVMAGQEVTVNGKRFVNADLAALQRREETLLIRYKREQRGGRRPQVTGIPRRP